MRARDGEGERKTEKERENIKQTFYLSCPCDTSDDAETCQ